MRLWPFTSAVETKSVPSSLANPDPALLELFNLGGGDVIGKAEALRIPAVNAAIRVISEAASSLGIAVERKQADGTFKGDDKHPVATLLSDHVNDWTSTSDFIRDLIASALVNDTGGIAWVNRVGAKPMEIVLYRPGFIAVSYADSGEPTYSINTDHVPAADIIHLRGAFQQSPLTMALRAISVAWHLENHAIGLFKNGARPGGVIEIPGQMAEDALRRMRSGWRTAFAGSANGGDTATLWNGAKFTAMAFNSTDAQFLENRRFQIEEIARAFNMPVQMLGDTTKSSYANAEQKQKEFLNYCLEPWLQAVESAMRRALFDENERTEYRIRFDRDDLTRADLATRANAINSLIASETINPNTGRDWLGLSPYDGGNTYGNRNITVGKLPVKAGTVDLPA